MKGKKQKILGMILFSALVIFLLWYVNYDDMELVGFRTNPSGYDSIAYLFLRNFIDASYPHTAINAWWALTQAIPVLVSWVVRSALGKCIHYLGIAISKLYSSV